MGLISWSTAARALVATCLLASTATGLGPIVKGNYTIPIVSTQAPVATSVHPAATDKAALLKLASRPLVPAFHSVHHRCPAKCSDAGHNPANWTVYHSTGRLAWCNQTMLLDFTIHNPLHDPSTHISIRSCSTDNDINTIETPSRLRRDVDVPCAPAPNDKEIQVPLQEASLGSASQDNIAEVAAAAQQMLNYLTQANASCNSTALFASTRPASLGIYAGSQMQAQGVSITTLQQFIDQIQHNGVPEKYLVQLCGSDDRGVDFALGIAAQVDSNLDFVQTAVSTWSNGKCVTTYGGQTMELSSWKNATLLVPSTSSSSNSSKYGNTAGTTTTQSRRALQVRVGDCTSIQVVSGDSCATLATKCGISGADLTEYNIHNQPALCSTLTVGEHVCCSQGSLPNFSPQPKADGSCAAYLVVADDSCSALAATYSLTIDEIEVYNNVTWGWNGCGNLQIGVNMCLSTGRPPMPAPIVNAVCGPQVVGTPPPPATQNIADLNACPLNACCDIWGQCGTTDDFCTVSYSIGDAPGTAAPGQNGCISNCGTGLVIGDAPAEFMKVGYFEGFNHQRECLTMDVTDINIANYTHVHLAFGTITVDFNVNVSAIQDQFDLFVGMTGFKKILSFGGWSFSTDTDSYPIFREGVTDANRATFIANLVSFVATNDIDGLDFDWEYPGAPDIPGIPAGSPDDGLNYFLFLYELRIFLPSEKTISIAAPASFWYLKGFPIDAMSVIFDYVIFMTYDLHGQWDYGNAFSDPGCPLGNCLRSHVNLTETLNSLAMITKAGVPSNKVVSGITSYGRSFEMTTPGCTGETCTYTGPLSGATPGQCTQTAGYIANAEIDAIIADGGTSTYQDSSLSNILIYNETQWVAYMDDDNKAIRTSLFAAYNLGGSTEWAIDLAGASSGDAIDDDDDDDDDGTGNSTAPCDYTLSFTSLADLEAVADKYTVYCAEFYTLQALSSELVVAYANYTDVNNGYDGLFGYYVDYVKNMVPTALDTFMAADGILSEIGPGNQYFQCTLNVAGVNSTVEACPILNVKGDYNVYYTMTNSTGFYDDLINNYGIESSWVRFNDYTNQRCDDVNPNNSGCVDIGTYYGYPLEASNLNVTNPKDIITAAGPNMDAIQAKIDATYIDTIMGQWGGSGLDAVQVLAMPVAMVQQAIAAMAIVKSIGKTEKKEEQTNLIINILTAVFAIIPFVGEASSGLAGLAQIGRIITLTGEAANAGLDMYSVVEHPETAAMQIFGGLIGAGALARDSESFAKLANARRGMSADDVTALGSIFKDQTTSINKIVRSCAA